VLDGSRKCSLKFGRGDIRPEFLEDVECRRQVVESASKNERLDGGWRLDVPPYNRKAYGPRLGKYGGQTQVCLLPDSQLHGVAVHPFARLQWSINRQMESLGNVTSETNVRNTPSET
jgi:hypothetical protein